MSEGIVTLADANYWPGLETLYVSVQDTYPVPVYCFDIGLTHVQKERAAREYKNLHILPIPDSEDFRLTQTAFEGAAPLSKPGKRVWPLWLCPFLIAASPCRRVFWIDSDALVFRGLKELFAMLDTGPVFTVENNAPELTPNKPDLYRMLPITRQFDMDEPRVNAGVSGWDLERDQEVLQAYMQAVRMARDNIPIREAISWQDQGALIWAIQKTGCEERVLQDTRWNLCVRHSPVANNRYNFGPAALEQLRADEPNAYLLHWNGYPVPW